MVEQICRKNRDEFTVSRGYTSRGTYRYRVSDHDDLTDLVVEWSSSADGVFATSIPDENGLVSIMEGSLVGANN